MLQAPQEISPSGQIKRSWLGAELRNGGSSKIFGTPEQSQVLLADPRNSMHVWISLLHRQNEGSEPHFAVLLSTKVSRSHGLPGFSKAGIIHPDIAISISYSKDSFQYVCRDRAPVRIYLRARLADAKKDGQ